MKVSRDKEFKPVTITLESEDEVRALEYMVGTHSIHQVSAATGISKEICKPMVSTLWQQLVKIGK